MATTATRLTEVQDAISAIVGGAQEYTVNGRTVKKAELADLMRLETRLKNQVHAETNTRGGLSVVNFQPEG